MLDINNISYFYKTNKIFENISFSVKKWIILITWPSWSGKTTFLKTIWWYINPTFWSVFFEKKNIWKDIVNYRKNNWFHFQDYNLLDLNVNTNINLPFIIWKHKKDINWITYLLEYFEIWKLIYKDINTISWWEKERVSIINAFAIKPKIVFLDEAWSALDKRLKNKLFEFINNYWKENIIFLVTHNKDIKKCFEINKILYDWNFQIFK